MKVQGYMGMSRPVRTAATLVAALALALLASARTGAAADTSKYEAENATISQGVVESNHAGYSGTGFVNGDNVAGSYTEWTVTAPAAGSANLVLRYANGTTTGRPMNISVNGTVVASAKAFNGTGSWDTWADGTLTAALAAGTNKIRATATTADGNPNLDYLTVTTGTGGGGPAVPFGSHLIPYASGTLRPSGSQATLDQAVITYYNKWKAAFLKQNCGNGWYEVISPDADHPYVAEGQGYGMVILATMAGADPNAKTAFDGMVKYMLAHPSVNNPNLLAAEQDTSCRSVNGSDSATDGDLDVAFGLLLADRQWGSAGTYNYKDLAVKHINAIKASEVNPTTHLMRLGDWSTSGDSTYYISRSSDWLIDHFRAFKKATGDTAWDTIRTAHQNLITSQQATYASSTGLLADFVVNTNTTPKPAPGQVLEDPNDGKYFWNACRDPWRIGADAVTTGDSASLASARKLNTWIKANTGGDPNKIAVGYALNGTQIGSGSEPAFFAPFAVAAMTDPGSQAWLDALWTKMLNTSFTSNDYYSTSIQLQVMILASGNYWVP
ncbi:glycosyl hydrolase family 8 [Sphaerisporangium sp. NPDC051011]|uniref:glycosyl hydrolase family 8 n=1 Tax=Sphaerisporangium sp. NPDC051011 TaxID=3155792 RepID=UPI0033F64244